VLAQYVMLELVRNARFIWIGLMELAGMMPPDGYTTAGIDACARLVRASDVAWLGRLLHYSEPTDDDGARRPGSRYSLTVQIEGELDDVALADRVVVTTQLAERLDRGTLELAMRIVPVEWWAARFGTTASTDAPITSVDREAGPAQRPGA
jgi:hypothetical protein